MSHVPSLDRIRWISAHVVPLEGRLRKWLSSRRLSWLDVDDIVQETYVRLIRVDDISTINNPWAYIRQVAWSVMVSHLRKERVVPLQSMADLNELGIAANEPSPEQQAFDRDELHRLGEAIGRLPGKIGEVFRLRRVVGMPQREVAESLGLAESTIEKHLKKALLLLMGEFARGGNGASEASTNGNANTEAGNVNRTTITDQ
jgi:RNA polymerase sigma-70 factor (ECF subfamily)